MPAHLRVQSPDDSMCEIEVDDEAYHRPDENKDRGGESDGDAAWSVCPNYPHDTSYASSHAKAKHGARYDEVVSMFAIDLENGHMADSAE